MESNLRTNLTSGLSYKSEVKSILTVQTGAKYGFLVEIESPVRTYYCPVEGYKSKDIALKALRSKLRQ